MLRKEHRLRIFESQSSKDIIWAEERAGRLSELHSEKLHNLYSSPNITRAVKSWIMR
jgi:hypothetical protein